MDLQIKKCYISRYIVFIEDRSETIESVKDKIQDLNVKSVIVLWFNHCFCSIILIIVLH